MSALSPTASTALTVASWVAALACLASYAVLARGGGRYQSFVVNAMASVPLLVSAAAKGLWPQAMLSAFYGLVAVVGLLRGRHHPGMGSA